MEVGVPRGGQLEALLAALVLQDAGQQLVGRAQVVAEERARLPRGVPQRLGQPQRPGAVQPSLVPAQLLILERGAHGMSANLPTVCLRGVLLAQKPTPLSGGNCLVRKELQKPPRPPNPKVSLADNCGPAQEGLSGQKTVGKIHQLRH